MRLALKYKIDFEQLQLYAVVLFVFLLPFTRKAIPPVIAVWTVIWIIRGKIKEKIFNIPKTIAFYIPVIFFTLYIAGISYSENIKPAFADVETKFSILLFPFIIFSETLFFKKHKNILMFLFVLANIISALTCFGYAFFRTVKYDINYFIYTDFSLFLHTSYASLYALLSMGICFYFIFSSENLFKDVRLLKSNKFMKSLMLSSCILLCVFIYFLSSRTGIITAFFTLAVISVYYLIQKKKWYLLIPVLGAFTFLPYYVFHLNDRFLPFKEFIEKPLDSINPGVSENVAVRYLVALSSVEIIKGNFSFGVGTGDVKDELEKEYKKKKIVFALEPSLLNAHNQFLETAIALGIPGAISLLALVLYPFYYGIKNAEILPVFFSLIAIPNFMTESMLNVQAGTVFFSFFYCLLTLKEQK